MNNLFKAGFKSIGMFSIAAMVAGLSACGGVEDIRKTISMEYLEAKTGKPIVYPAGIDAPEVSNAFAVPPLPPANRANNADINELVVPPSLLPPDATDGEDDDPDDKTAMASPRSETGDAE